MHVSLVSLYQSENISRGMLLKKKLTSTRMGKIDTIASYLMKITELRDQLVAVGDNVEENELNQINLKLERLWSILASFCTVYVLMSIYLHSKAYGMPLSRRRSD
jgi:hypothetical protein